MDTTEVEAWAPIPSSPGDSVSSLGRVKGVTEKVLKQSKNAEGYMQVSIGYPPKLRRVHRLVAEAFGINPESKPQINHKNGNRDDNRLLNLEAVTAQENNTRQVFPNKKNRTSSKKVVQLTRDLELVRIWNSASEAARAYGVGNSAIINCLKKGTEFSSCGYRWMFLHDYEDPPENEEWKEIVVNDGTTLGVSSMGRIRLKRGGITSGTEIAGYLVVYPDGRGHLVHRLVATAFVANTEKKEIVNHIDGNRHNNAAVNLEWVTRKENADHAVATGLHKVQKVKMIEPDGKETIFNSISEASRVTGIHRTCIEDASSGRHLTAGGVWWERYVPGIVPDDDPIWAELGI